MSTERHTTVNRSGLKFTIQVDTPDEPKDLVFIAHGQGGFMGQEHIKAYAEVFLQHHFRVVRFDATHAVGESEGDMLNLTYDSYIEDLEDTIAWARTQAWFQQPFAFCGHSMGAQSTVWYAEHHLAEVSLLVAGAPVINYEMHLSNMDDDYKNMWQSQGYIELGSRSKPGLVKRIGWGVQESLKKFDLLSAADKLTIPVLDLVGEFDRTCPVKQQRIFMESVASTDKTLVIIPDTEHSYRDAKTNQYDNKLNQVKGALTSWLQER